MSKTKALAVISVLSLIMLALVILGVKYNPSVKSMDNAVMDVMQLADTPFILSSSNYLGTAFGTISMTILTILVSCYLLFKRKWKDAIFFSTVMLTGALLNVGLKLMVARPRPANSFLHFADYSLPSGHAASAFIFCGLITYLVIKETQSVEMRWGTAIVSGIIVLIVCFSRLALGVHYFTDILAGIFFGSSFLFGCIILREYAEREELLKVWSR